MSPPAGAVVYRIPLTWRQNKLPWKLLHAALMLLALILSIIGLQAVFYVHNAKGIPPLYSLHSWVGIAATALFATQVNTKRITDTRLIALLWVKKIKLCVLPICSIGQSVGGGYGWFSLALLPNVTP